VLVGGEVDESEWEEEDESEEDDFNLAPAEESLIATPLATLPTTDDLTGEAAQPPSDGPPTECPKCGAGLSDGMLCDACGYNVQLKRVIHSDVETFEANPDIGFKRWFNSQLAEGESLGSIWKWILVGGGLVFGAMTLALLPDSLCFAIPVVIIAGVVYVLIKRSGKPSDQAFFDAGTRGSLALLRIVGWRKMEWPFPKVPSYSAKGTNFDDKDLASMSDVGEIEALDLDGCAITDAGLVHLAAWTQLRYLVLTNTSVTREAAIELQNKLNKTMVWL
jgi:hypothetical protein